MDFTFIENLRLTLENSDVFGWKFLMAGCKSMALALLMFKFLNIYISDFSIEEPKLGGLFNLAGYACMIMSCDWILGFIEGIFSSVDAQMYQTPNDIYAQLQNAIVNHSESLTMDYELLSIVSFPLDAFANLFYTVVLNILVGLFKLADMAMTASYLLLRLFLLQLTKLLFPIVIALSTLDITKDLLGRWIKRYIGLFILGLVYIAIINFCSAIQDALIGNFALDENGELWGMGHFVYGSCITVVVVFTFKVKVFSSATSYINSFFS